MSISLCFLHLLTLGSFIVERCVKIDEFAVFSVIAGLYFPEVSTEFTKNQQLLNAIALGIWVLCLVLSLIFPMILKEYAPWQLCRLPEGGRAVWRVCFSITDVTARCRRKHRSSVSREG